jgi:dTDP-4-amino-4,6-dideoxygalactose transaminase
LPDELLRQLRDTADICDGHLFRFVLRGSRIRFDIMQCRFAALGISVRRGVDQLAHRREGTSDSEFPNAIKAYNETLSLPFYPKLENRQATQVLEAARTVLKA